jgi:hypothetical protein
MMTRLALASALATAGLAAGGPVWCEDQHDDGDAGSTTPSAQRTQGSGKVECVEGSTCTAGPACPDFEDMYLIHICDPEGFSAATVPEGCGSASFNTQLWLFQAAPSDVLLAFGRIANDDGPPPPGTLGSRIVPVPDDGSPALKEPGLYYLAISGFNDDPRSVNGLIFDVDLPTEVSGPDGPGGDDPLFGWVFGQTPETGLYRIALTGAAFANYPTTDCNDNFIADTCDIADGTSPDTNGNGVPDECEQCLADLTGPGGAPDGNVDALDYLYLIAQWGTPCMGPCDADITGPALVPDGNVDALDFLLLIVQWGTPANC